MDDFDIISMGYDWYLGMEELETLRFMLDRGKSECFCAYVIGCHTRHIDIMKQYLKYLPKRKERR